MYGTPIMSKRRNLIEIFQKTLNMRRKKNYYYFIFVSVAVYLYHIFSVGDHLFSKSYENEFNYILNIDIRPVVKDVLSGKKPSIEPINFYPYRFLTNSGKCSAMEFLDLFIVVKSAIGNFDKRIGIRQTYGQENILPGRIIRVLFFVGIDHKVDSPVQKKIDQEIMKFKDIIQIDFLDNYDNNTIKTMMSFRWLYEHCSNADYYLFTDDDMYISVKNLLVYVTGVASTTNIYIQKLKPDKYSVALWNEKLKIVFAGYKFKKSPQRFRFSKWYITLDEYPWDHWPPYLAGAAYVVSNHCMKILYASSLFVKHFRFDDVYLGIVAKKIGIEPLNCPHIYCKKKTYSFNGYKDVIASHGYGDPEELIRVWNEQNKL